MRDAHIVFLQDCEDYKKGQLVSGTIQDDPYDDYGDAVFVSSSCLPLLRIWKFEDKCPDECDGDCPSSTIRWREATALDLLAETAE